MQIKINGRDVNLTFGLACVKRINQLKGMNIPIEGMEFNTETQGLTFLNLGLNVNDPSAIADLVESATITEKNKPNRIEIEQYIEDLMNKDDDFKSFEKFAEELKEGLSENSYVKYLVAREMM